MNLGIDELLANAALRKQLEGRRVALLGHPASVTSDCQHSLDALMACPDINVVSAFGPQHGMRGDKQDNMVESEDYIDPHYRIPVYSLYGEFRRPTKKMLETCDIVLVDLQDIGTRIYTFITTLFYTLEACAEYGKSIWIMDRPNPAGRPIDGTILEPGWASFVGAAPIPMRHGLILSEAARWFVDLANLDVDMKIIPMTGYSIDSSPGYGWPVFELPWVNPSPNASSLNMARCYAGTVLIEGTTLSEGRGTTTPLEMVGAPDIDFDQVLKRMCALSPQWLQGCTIRRCYFEPVFSKHQGKLCSGIQIHTDNSAYRHTQFRPYRLISLLLKVVRLEYPDYKLWRNFAYEYETKRLAIDLLGGGTFLRNWVDDPQSKIGDLDERLLADEQQWSEMRAPYLCY